MNTAFGLVKVAKNKTNALFTSSFSHFFIQTKVSLAAQFIIPNFIVNVRSFVSFKLCSALLVKKSRSTLLT